MARLIPLGQGWVLEPVEKGFVLKGLALSMTMQVTPEEAQSLRQGDMTPEQMAQRHGVAVPHPPPGAVTVAFSDEAMRLAGKGRAEGQGGSTARPQPMVAGAGLDLPRTAMIGAVIAALLLLALIRAI